ncbi:MAG TPA: hypothetical protein VKD46_03860 [bacterium]|nr:hypothetical protein [bacterium]
MPVVIWNSSPDWNADLYEQTATKLWGSLVPDELPEGAIAHIAMPRPEGGWQVLDVWETEQAYQAFLQTKLIPAATAVNAPPFDSTIIQAHTVLTR